MKTTTKFIIPLCIALTLINLKAMATNANPPNTSSNIVYNSNQNIIEIKGAPIDGKLYNIQFIYGNLSEAYKETQYQWLNDIPNPIKAFNTINEILNTSNPVPQVITEKPNNRKYPASYKNNFYMIPIEITERTYKETSIEIKALYSIFDPETKQWQTSVVDAKTFQYKFHGPRTAGVYTKFEEVEITK